MEGHELIQFGAVSSAEQKISMDYDLTEEKVQTAFGQVTVAVAGDRRRKAIITFHDLGLNANSCFQSFFQFSEMSVIAERFCVYHINAPGQEADASTLSDGFVYPSMDDLAQIVFSVTEHFQIKSFIGFGVGVGANVLCRYALKHRNKVDALILVNCTAWAAGWIEWGYSKVNVRHLRSAGMTTFVVDYLLWYHFGKHLERCNEDLVESYRQFFNRSLNSHNLAAFTDAWTLRTPLNISFLRTDPLTKKPDDGIPDVNTSIKCPVLQLVGWDSAHVDETVDVNSRLDPANSNWMKVADASGLVLEDAPDRCTEAIILFLQGLGYFPSLSHVKWVERRKGSLQSPSSTTPDGSSTSSPAHTAGGDHRRQPPTPSAIVQHENEQQQPTTIVT